MLQGNKAFDSIYISYKTQLICRDKQKNNTDNNNNDTNIN